MKTCLPGTPTSTPPPMAARAGVSKIGVKISVPEEGHRTLLFPPSNLGGMMLLERLFIQALGSAAVHVQTIVCGGPLNDCLFLLDVAQRGRALQTILSELRACHLAPWSELAWLDEAEGVWRSYPGGHPLSFSRHVDGDWFERKCGEMQSVLRLFQSEENP